MLEVGGVLRIYHMVVEVFGGRQCVTVVGDNNMPINTRKGEEMDSGKRIT